MYKDKDTGGPKHGSYTLGVGVTLMGMEMKGSYSNQCSKILFRTTYKILWLIWWEVGEVWTCFKNRSKKEPNETLWFLETE